MIASLYCCSGFGITRSAKHVTLLELNRLKEKGIRVGIGINGSTKTNMVSNHIIICDLNAWTNFLICSPMLDFAPCKEKCTINFHHVHGKMKEFWTRIGWFFLSDNFFLSTHNLFDLDQFRLQASQEKVTNFTLFSCFLYSLFSVFSNV